MTEPMTNERLEILSEGTGFTSLEVTECVGEIHRLRKANKQQRKALAAAYLVLEEYRAENAKLLKAAQNHTDCYTPEAIMAALGELNGENS